MNKNYDYLIVGAGIIGMSIAHRFMELDNSLRIAIIEKESDVALHASGRNSGVLHAGFYYSKESLKAKFTADGNKKMRAFCCLHNIYVNNTKKIVIAQSHNELKGIEELHKRAQINGVKTFILNEKEVAEIDPNIKTFQKALYSPNTASVNPKEVCLTLKNVLLKQGVDFYFNTPFSKSDVHYDYLINAAGSYADKIAKEFNLARHYTLLPFKGIYMKYMKDKNAIRTNVYPVPNLNNPFLGVHYTVTVDGSIKIGPTAIPAFWRENYKGFKNFSLSELIEILYYETKLFLLNSFHFRDLALEEMKNYNPKFLINKAKKMLHSIGDDFRPMDAGIRAQLLNTQTNELVQDFILEHTKNSTHVLNAVSPAFTCSFAFAEYVVDTIMKNKGVT